MGKMLWIGLMAAALAVPVAAADRTPPVPQHCQHEDARDCTAANGRIDAEWLAARNQFGFHIFGGPALPQEPLKILHEEYTKAGIEVWWTGDIIDIGRDDYYNAFNKRMEEAIDARRGRGYVGRVHDRIAARMKAVEARDKARAAAKGAR
jgi:hypothetical protein